MSYYFFARIKINDEIEYQKYINQSDRSGRIESRIDLLFYARRIIKRTWYIINNRWYFFKQA